MLFKYSFYDFALIMLLQGCSDLVVDFIISKKNIVIQIEEPITKYGIDEKPHKLPGDYWI